MPPLSCGLDFGTSNSTLGIAGKGAAPHLVPLEGESLTLPSILFFSFEDGDIHFGRDALAEYVTGAEGRLMRSLKSVLGTPLMADVTRIKARQIKFIDILGVFIAEMKRRAEAMTRAELTHAVLGRPVHFVDGDAKADAEAQHQLELAARAQGFTHIEFQFEPIAAALDYERGITGEELALVVDIGGGTSDFTVIRVSPERARRIERQDDILSTAGVHIGGTDFDRLLSMHKIMGHLGYRSMTKDHTRALPNGPYYDLATWHRINRLYTSHMLIELRQTRREALHPERIEQLIAVIEDRQGHRLAASVEAAKIGLTDTSEVQFDFEAPGVTITQAITRNDLDAAIHRAVSGIGETIRTALADAGVSAPAIQTLILTGGSTQIPAIVQMLTALFPDARQVMTDAFGSVGLGLSLDAARRF